MYKKIITYIISVVFLICHTMPCAYAKYTRVLVAEDFETFSKCTSKLSENLTESEISTLSLDNTDSKFLLNRLIVHTNSKIDYFGASHAIEGYDDLIILQYETEEETKSAYESYLKNPDIDYVEPDILVNLFDNDTYDYEISDTQTLSWGYGADYINTQAFFDTYLTDKELPEITVAVIDTGIDSDHTMFSERITNGRNFISTSSYPEDDNGHGSHVSGIICEGTLQNVSIMPVKSMNASGAGSTLTVTNGIKYAKNNGADIINMSIGAIGTYSSDSLWTKTITEAINSGCTVITASGNFKMNVSNCTPANVPETISVAATNKSNTLATGFSNYGDDIDISAPGQSILNAHINNGTKTRSGTSMSCPHVSACAANVLSYDDTLSPNDVETLLEYNAKPMTKTKNYYTGAGIVYLGDFEFSAITLDKTEINTVKGAKHLLTANVYPASDISFESSDNEILTVDTNGNIVTLSNGEAKVTATANGVSTICTVTVNEIGEWYNAESKEMFISTPDELVNLSELVNNKIDNFSGKTVNLASDIDMAEIEFLPVGSSDFPFLGTFAGNNHSISNLLNTTYLSRQGLFGVTGNTTVIRDVNIKNTTAESESVIGAIAGTNYGKIINCSVSGTVCAKNSMTVLSGGIAGINFGEIINSKNSATISLKNAVVSAAGGICAKNMGTVINCINTGNISGTEYRQSGSALSGSLLYSGGIAAQNGTNDTKGNIINCLNTGSILNTAASSTDSLTGTICAYISNGEIKNAYFSDSEAVSLGKTSSIAECENILSFENNILSSPVNIGSFSGDDLISSLNAYAKDYNTAADEKLYLWYAENNDFSLHPTLFYMNEKSIVSDSINPIDGEILVAEYDSDNVCTSVIIYPALNINHTVETSDTSSYIRAYWWNANKMIPLQNSIKYLYQ